MTPRLAYVAGFSRSGSTLLELLLATHPQVVSVGELQVLPHELLGADGSTGCGCGEPVAVCPFWSAVLADVDPLLQRPPRLHHFRETHRWGPSLRPGQLLALRRELRPAERAAVDQYGENTRALLDAIAATLSGEGAPPAVVVDASKDPYRLAWLARDRALDLRVVHLVRDPRGVVHSLTRRAGHPIVPAARRAAAWRLENRIVREVTRRHLPAAATKVVRYEDLARTPAEVVADLFAFLGLAPHDEAVADYPTVEVHAVAGNPMRDDRRPIVPDTDWVRNLPASRRILVDVLAGRSSGDTPPTR